VIAHVFGAAAKELPMAKSDTPPPPAPTETGISAWLARVCRLANPDFPDREQPPMPPDPPWLDLDRDPAEESPAAHPKPGEPSLAGESDDEARGAS
jgi:hypothetical protein